MSQALNNVILQVFNLEYSKLLYLILNLYKILNIEVINIAVLHSV